VNARATSFGQRATEYDRVRPEYSAEALDLAVSRLGLGAGADVLDLGAGTGKLTRALVERFRTVVAVEPDPGMRGVLTRSSEAHRVLEGRAEEIPLPDESVDAVFVAQAFHWFDTDAALPEIARVLRPGGGLVLIWNAWFDPEPPLPGEAKELMRSVAERAGVQPIRVEDEGWEWQSRFEGTGFEPLREEKIEAQPWPIDGERFVTLTLSTSLYGTLPPDEFERVERRLRELVTGEYQLPMRTELYWTRLSS
jgi:ubiquinone/menaquinone biosynthesis C-methylase UbiE